MTSDQTIFETRIMSDPSLVNDVCDRVRIMLEHNKLNDHLFAVDLLLREFINNGIRHGNRADVKKQVGIQVRVDESGITLRIDDEGPGFDWKKASQDIPEDDRTSGRGLVIGSIYAQRMQFNPSGNEVTLWIERSQTKGVSL